jgi:hypothetical protein
VCEKNDCVFSPDAEKTKTEQNNKRTTKNTKGAANRQTKQTDFPYFDNS